MITFEPHQHSAKMLRGCVGVQWGVAGGYGKYFDGIGAEGRQVGRSTEVGGRDKRLASLGVRGAGEQQAYQALRPTRRASFAPASAGIAAIFLSRYKHLVASHRLFEAGEPS